MAAKTSIYQPRFTPTVANVSGPPMNPLFSIWTQPREAIRFLIESDPALFVHSLSVLGCLSLMLGELSMFRAAPKDVHIGVLLLILVCAACFLGTIQLYVLSGLFTWIGRLLGGRGLFQDVRTAVAWCNVPLVVGLFVFWGPGLCIFGRGLFTAARPEMGANADLFFSANGFLILHLAFAVWALAILIMGVAEAHQVSNVRGLGTVAATVAGSAVVWLILSVTFSGAFSAIDWFEEEKKPAPRPMPPTFVDGPY